MLKVSAKEYIELGNRIEQARVIFHLTKFHKPTDSGRGLSDREQDDLRKILIQIFDLCTALNLPISGDLISQHFDVDHGHLPETLGEFDILVAATMAELKTRLFFFVPTYVAKYYDLIVPSIITVAFPAASQEIVAAGNALACNLHTASVFHSMRAAEIGVRALGRALGVSFPTHPIELAEWQTILEQTRSKIDAMKALPRGTHKDEELAFYSDAATQLWYFKDAWRVRVAHARANYEMYEAAKVFDHTFSLFQTLATRLKESQP
jgi:hypothetical protein